MPEDCSRLDSATRYAAAFDMIEFKIRRKSVCYHASRLPGPMQALRGPEISILTIGFAAWAGMADDELYPAAAVY